MDKGCNCTGSEQSHTGTLDIKKIKDYVSKPALKAHAKHVLCVYHVLTLANSELHWLFCLWGKLYGRYGPCWANKHFPSLLLDAGKPDLKAFREIEHICIDGIFLTTTYNRKNTVLFSLNYFKRHVLHKYYVNILYLKIEKQCALALHTKKSVIFMNLWSKEGCCQEVWTQMAEASWYESEQWFDTPASVSDR